jgi:hypothetical protein
VWFTHPFLYDGCDHCDLSRRICNIFCRNDGGHTSAQLAALTITALSGFVGEILQYKNVTIDTIYRQSKEFIGAAAQQALTRWGTVAIALLLKQYNTKYEQIVHVRVGNHLPLHI